MKITLKKYDNTIQFIEQFGKLLSPSFSKNIFGSPKFLEYHKNIKCSYLTIEKSNLLIGYLPFSVNDKSFISHEGATYGGFIQLENLQHTEVKEIYYEILLYLKNLKVQKLIIRFLPEIFSNNEQNDLNLYFKSKMNLLYSEEEYYISLSENIENIDTTNFRRNHKREIRNFSNTTFEIIESINLENIKVFHNLLSENLKKHNVKPTHSLSELRWLLENLNNQFNLTLIKNSDTYLSGLVKISINQNTDYIIYGSLNYTQRPNGSLKYLYWYTAKQSYLNGKSNLTFGINNKHFEEKNKNLDIFKLGFGCSIINREMYEMII